VSRGEATIATATTARLGRPPRIGRDDILDALDRRLTGAWTMAALAAELGVSEAAIYYYFPTKGDVISALGERVMADFGLPKLDGDWAAWLWHVGHEVYEFVRRHPFLVDPANSDTLAPAFEAPYFRICEDALTDLVSAGFTLVNAASAYSLIGALAYQHATTAISWSIRGAQPRQSVEQLIEEQPDSLLGQFAMSIANQDPERRRADALGVALSVAIAGIRSELIGSPRGDAEQKDC